MVVVLSMAIVMQVTQVAPPQAVTDLPRVVMEVFDCSHRADYLQNIEARDRLFDYGMTAGMVFLDAYDRNALSQEQIDNHVPYLYRDMTPAPSQEFMLGMVYQSRWQHARGSRYSFPGQREWQQGIYEKMNCDAHGHGDPTMLPLAR